jgi:hypothetical protein
MSEMSEKERAEIELFEQEGEMSDNLFAMSVLRGCAVGMPVVGAFVWLAFIVSDVSISDRGIIGLALWSALWAGLLLGGVIGLGVKLISLEAKVNNDH